MARSEASIRWRDDEKIPWKEVVEKYAVVFGENVRKSALQMRYKSAKDRAQIWTLENEAALLRAHQFWLDSQYTIIKQKVT